MLLFGSREQIALRLAALRGEPPPDGTVGSDDWEAAAEAASLDFELNWSADPEVQNTLHTLAPPEQGRRLRAAFD